MAGGLVHLWNAWAIQILVVLSFGLQVLLLVFAGIRRRDASSALRLLIWLLYIVADSTAIYTLGHLSVSSSSSSSSQSQHQLVAFWAPFLLVHLGGQDSIAAYALEDNRLWLRHLLTLFVQAAGAAFVIYKYVATAGTNLLLLLADMLVFIVGVLKYGERIWALKCGNLSHIESMVLNSTGDIYKSIFSKDLRFHFPRGKGIIMYMESTHDHDHDDDEELLIAAHCLLHMCKSLFAGVLVTTTSFQLATIAIHTHSCKANLYRLVELELSLMYDILYTKAWVIHTWYGYCIRVVSLLAVLSAFLLFQLHLSNTSPHGPYNAVDLAITYLLLVGALVLEIISVCRTVGSTWMCALFYCLDWGRPLSLLKSLRRLVRAARKRRWSGSIGQFNIFDVCTRDTTKIASRVASKVGLKHWWNRMSFSGTTTLTASLKELLLEALPKSDAIKKPRGGLQILAMSWGLSKTLPKWSKWTVDADFEKGILVWHIATQVYLWESSKLKQQNSTEEADSNSRQQQLAEAIQVVSNYMMFLLVAKPDMLPSTAHAAHIRNSEYVHSCKMLERLYSTNHYHGSSISQQTQEVSQRILGNFCSIPGREVCG